MGNIVDHILPLENGNESLNIDFVLAFDSVDDNANKTEKRRVFEHNLQQKGLKLEYFTGGRIEFVKIFAPKEVIFRYAEILKFKLPLKPVPGQQLLHEKDSKCFALLRECFLQTCLQSKDNTPPVPRIAHEFSLRHASLYDLADPKILNSGMRNNIVFYILQHEHFVANEQSPIYMGIAKLLQDAVYLDAYPLHNDKDRIVLQRKWACMSRFLSLQPLHEVHQYFGAKIALYFAWLGFYIGMLVPLSLCGLVCFIYGLITLPTDPISRNICHNNQTILMCPLCDDDCDFWDLKSTCYASKVNYLLDNRMSVSYAIMISMWSVLYLKFWQQYSARLVHSWGLTGYSEQVEHPRPKYLSRIFRKRTLAVQLNAATSSLEPLVPFWSYKFLPYLTSYGILVLFICVTVIAIFTLIVYRMAQLTARSVLGDIHSKTHKILVLPITSAILYLAVISLLNLVYIRLAVLLTNFEYHRTQTVYEESLTIKYYIFQFVNYYTSLFYIAFIKSKFVGYPGKYKRIFGFRQEECNPGGCLIELCLQLVLIMVGKQAIKGAIGILKPYIQILVRSFCFYRKHAKVEVQVKSSSPWTRDYNLQHFTNDSIFKEYLEMVIQFGFLVLFGLLFPLAPLVALAYNVFELRLDAIKFLRLMKRPVAQREHSIGVSYNIMKILTSISVLVNAVIIAFSTNLIPKFVYVLVSGDESLDGFLDFELALFSTKDFEITPNIVRSRYKNVTHCRYNNYRNPSDHKEPYGRPIYYWYIWIGRLAFIVVYQNVIGLLQNLVAWVFSDTPAKLARRIKREDFLAREHISRYERQSFDELTSHIESEI